MHSHFVPLGVRCVRLIAISFPNLCPVMSRAAVIVPSPLLMVEAISLDQEIDGMVCLHRAILLVNKKGAPSGVKEG